MSQSIAFIDASVADHRQMVQLEGYTIQKKIYESSHS